MTYRRNLSAPGITVPPRSLDGWRFGVASGNPSMLAVGDSLTAGVRPTTITTDQLTNGYVGVLKAGQITRPEIGSLGAQYYPVIQNDVYQTAHGYPWAPNAAAAPWTEVVRPFALGTTSRYTVTVGSGFGTGAWIAGTNGANGANVLTFTVPFNIVAFDIIYVEETVTGSGGTTPTGRYQVGAGTVTDLPAVATASHIIKRVRVTGAVSAGTTIKLFNSNTTSNQFWPEGITCYASTTAGLQLAWCGFMSESLNDLGPNQYNNQVGRSSATSEFGQVGFPAVPHLCIMALGNADSYIVSAETYAGRLATYVRMMRRAGEVLYGSGFRTSFILLSNDRADNPARGITGGPNDALSFGTDLNAESYQGFQRYQKAVAEELGMVWIDLAMRWNQRPKAKGFMQDSDPHWLDAGHADVAAAIASVL